MRPMLRRPRITSAVRRACQTITDMAFVNGKLIVAGLSNEEWSSALRSIPFPFTQAEKGATIQIWHASHGDFETASARAHLRALHALQGQPYILAAYTCTPLVKIPRQRPEARRASEGHHHRRPRQRQFAARHGPLPQGWARLHPRGQHQLRPGAREGRSHRNLSRDHFAHDMDVGGVPSERLAEYKGVAHLTQLDDASAVILTSANGSQNLQTIALP